MIIVEGPDNSGKSTLIKQLLELDPGLRILKRKKFDRHKDQTIGTSYLEELIPKDGDRVSHGYAIADRFFASECIYGTLFRNGCRMTASEHRAVRNLLVSYGTVLVYCRPPRESIEKTWNERPQLYDRDPLRIYNEYEERLYDIFKGADQASFNYDWTHRSAYDMRSNIISTHQNIFNDQKEALTWWSAHPQGIGQLRDPDVVFIGEELGPRAVVPVPFVSGPAADFLTKSIMKLCRVIGDYDSEFYYTNADKGLSNNAAALRHELSNLGSARAIVTLGNVAGEMFEFIRPTLPSYQQDAKWVTMPHPMYWRRFRWKQRHEYAEMLVKQLEPLFREIA